MTPTKNLPVTTFTLLTIFCLIAFARSRARFEENLRIYELEGETLTPYNEFTDKLRISVENIEDENQNPMYRYQLEFVSDRGLTLIMKNFINDRKIQLSDGIMAVQANVPYVLGRTPFVPQNINTDSVLIFMNDLVKLNLITTTGPGSLGEVGSFFKNVKVSRLEEPIFKYHQIEACYFSHEKVLDILRYEFNIGNANTYINFVEQLTKPDKNTFKSYYLAQMPIEARMRLLGPMLSVINDKKEQDKLQNPKLKDTVYKKLTTEVTKIFTKFEKDYKKVSGDEFDSLAKQYDSVIKQLDPTIFQTAFNKIIKSTEVNLIIRSLTLHYKRDGLNFDRNMTSLDNPWADGFQRYTAVTYMLETMFMDFKSELGQIVGDKIIENLRKDQKITNAITSIFDTQERRFLENFLTPAVNKINTAFPGLLTSAEKIMQANEEMLMPLPYLFRMTLESNQMIIMRFLFSYVQVTISRTHFWLMFMNPEDQRFLKHEKVMQVSSYYNSGSFQSEAALTMKKLINFTNRLILL